MHQRLVLPYLVFPLFILIQAHSFGGDFFFFCFFRYLKVGLGIVSVLVCLLFLRGLFFNLSLRRFIFGLCRRLLCVIFYFIYFLTFFSFAKSYILIFRCL